MVETNPIPSPSYSSGTATPRKPSSPALRIISSVSAQSFFSSLGLLGTTSRSTNSLTDSFIITCSSLKSSGVNISSQAVSFTKNCPPRRMSFFSAVSIMYSFLIFSSPQPSPKEREQSLISFNIISLPLGELEGL